MGLRRCNSDGLGLDIATSKIDGRGSIDRHTTGIRVSVTQTASITGVLVLSCNCRPYAVCDPNQHGQNSLNLDMTADQSIECLLL